MGIMTDAFGVELTEGALVVYLYSAPGSIPIRGQVVELIPGNLDQPYGARPDMVRVEITELGTTGSGTNYLEGDTVRFEADKVMEM